MAASKHQPVNQGLATSSGVVHLDFRTYGACGEEW